MPESLSVCGVCPSKVPELCTPEVGVGRRGLGHPSVGSLSWCWDHRGQGPSLPPPWSGDAPASSVCISSCTSWSENSLGGGWLKADMALGNLPPKPVSDLGVAVWGREWFCRGGGGDRWREVVCAQSVPQSVSKLGGERPYALQSVGKLWITVAVVCGWGSSCSL